MPRVSLKTVFKEKELWILILLGILFFYRPLFLKETFFIRDLYTHFVPQHQRLADFVQAGELPLWDPYMHGGQPYLGHISNSAFYPSNLLYVFLPLLRAFNLDIVLHFIGGLIFTYLLSRIIGLQPISSFIASVVYGFCGYTLSLMNILNLFWAMSHLPLLLLFWHLFWLEGKRKWGIFTIFVGVIQVLASAPEVSVLSFLSLLGWTLVYPYPRQSLYQRLILWIFLAIFTIGIASVHIIPTIELILQSTRLHALNYASFACWSLSPRRLPEMVFPGFLGYADVLPREVYYWGRNLIDESFPYIISIYFGGIAVVLACIGGIHRGHNQTFPFSVRFFLLALFVLSLLLAFGHYLSCFRFLYQYVPFIRVFRYPIKFLIAGILPFALLAGYASEVHFGGGEFAFQGQKSGSQTWAPSSKFVIVLWSIAVIFVIFTLTFLFSDKFANRFHEVFFQQFRNDVSRRGLGFSFAHTSAVWLLAALLYQYRQVKKKRWQHSLLAGIIVLDLVSTGEDVNFYAPEKLFTEEPQIVQLIREEIGDGRLFRVEHFSEVNLQIPVDNPFQVPPDNIMWGSRWEFEVLNWYLASFYRIPVIFHKDITRLAPEHLATLTTLIHSLSWEHRLPFLSASGVTLIITSEDLSVPGIRRLAEIPNWSDVSFYLYRNERAAARVALVTNWNYVTSDDEALKMMLSLPYDPRKQVVLQKPKSTFFEQPFKITSPQKANSNFSECNGSSQIKKITSNTHSALFNVSNNCEGYLVFSEPFYPGWRVYVDGKPTPIFRANYAFSAIFLPAGEHEVKRFYRPNSLLLGALSSLVFCVLLWVVLNKYKGL